MIKPVEYLAYVYYKCSWCGDVGDEVRLVETKSRKHICISCGNEDDIEPITGIKFSYDKPPKETNKNPPSLTTEKLERVINSISLLGWGKDESRYAVVAAANKYPNVSIQELFRLSILELDNAKQFKTNKAN